MLPFHANDILREKPGYAKIRSSSLLRPPSLPSHPFPCYNWLRKDEGRIFRDRSGGKLTTWIPRGVCQLYPYFSVGNSRSHLRGRGWGVRCASDSRGSHTRLAKTGHGRRSKSSLSTKRNANTRRRRRRRGYERAAFQNATRFKINRSVDSCYYFSLSPSIFLFSVSLFSTSTREHVFFYNINIDDETDYFAVSLNKKYLKKIFRYWFLFFFFLIRPKNEREIYLICIFLRIIVKKCSFLPFLRTNPKLFIIRNNIRKKRAVVGLSIFFIKHSI